MNQLQGVDNPFRDAIVKSPWQTATSDILNVHGRAYQTCCEALETIRRRGGSRSVLLHGAAGSGKTHLLARLREHWLGFPVESEGLDRPEVVFVSVVLQTSPRRLWRWTRRCFAEDLSRPGRSGFSLLESILLHRLAEVRPAGGDLSLWWEWMRESHPDPDDLQAELETLLERLDPAGLIGRDLGTALLHILMGGRQRRDARAWLRGDPLPQSALEAMNLGAVAEEEDDLEDQARQIVVGLCHLAGPRTPIVFCFDQIEALQNDLGDQVPLRTFGGFVSSLFQQTNNILLISCIQSHFFDNLKSSVRQADWARLAIQQSTLDTFGWEDTQRLVTARMNTLPELAALRSRQNDPLWPLSTSSLQAKVGDVGETARRILAVAAELFEIARSGTIGPLVSVEQFLDAQWSERLEQAVREGDPYRADDILAHGLPMLVRVANPTWTVQTDHGQRDIDILLEGPEAEASIGLTFFNHRDLRKAWPKLKRLSEHAEHAQVQKLVVLRDSRLPMARESQKTHQILRKLTSEGAMLCRPSAEALAALDALRQLLSETKAGEVAHHGTTLAPQTVQEWLAAHLPSVLQDLVEDMLRFTYPENGRTEGNSELCDRLVEFLESEPVVTTAMAAQNLNVSDADIQRCVQDHPQTLGFLNGPPGVIFRLEPEVVEY